MVNSSAFLPRRFCLNTAGPSEVSFTSSADGQSYTVHYTYDAEGKLMMQSDETADGTTTYTFTYDANGNCIRQEGSDGSFINREFVTLAA